MARITLIAGGRGEKPDRSGPFRSYLKIERGGKTWKGRGKILTPKQFLVILALFLHLRGFDLDSFLPVVLQVPIIPVVFSSYGNFYLQKEKQFKSGNVTPFKNPPPSPQETPESRFVPVQGPSD